MRACDTVGGTVTAKLLRGGATFNTATQTVVVNSPPSITSIAIDPNDTEGDKLKVDFTDGAATHRFYLFELYRKDDGGAYPTEPSKKVQVTSSPAEFDNLTSGKWYKARGRNCRTSSRTNCGSWSSDSSEVFLLAKPVLDVIPLPRRKAELSWNAVTVPSTDTVEYVVEIRKHGETAWRYPILLELSSGTVSVPRYTVELDGVLLKKVSDSGNPGQTKIVWDKGLAHATAYDFRVKATASSGDRYSDIITIIDTPIYRVDGHNSAGTSTNGGQAVIKWYSLLSLPAKSGSYKVRYRRALPFAGVESPHTSPRWTPGSYDMHDTHTRDVTGRLQNSEYTLTGLTLGEIYAIQLSYTDANTGQRVHAARDAYVWPSTGFQEHDKRVATYPFFGHFTNKTYTYRICTDTFPPGTRSEWASLIEHALGQWQTATGNMIRTNRDLRACTDLSSMSRLEDLIKDDDSLSEIRMLDVSSLGSAVKLKEMHSDPFKLCIVGAPACVTSISGYDRWPRQASYQLSSADITLNQGWFANTRPETPHQGVRFNTCVSASGGPKAEDEGFFAYSTMVHEAGHALGLSDWSLKETAIDEIQKKIQELPSWARILLAPFSSIPEHVYEVSHPTIPDSVLNYDHEIADKLEIPTFEEPDCSPHPFDVMAIHALYQSVP